MTIITSKELAPPRGYSHGVLASGRLLFIAGQIGWNAAGQLVSDDFVEQFDQALANVIAVVREAGGTPESIARLTIYVTDKAEYRIAQASIGARYRVRMGKHYPAMTLVEVRALLEDAAKVEIEATAVL
ncbi:MAG TPA: RidA family protein [Vicinamibacterales bacterium]|jgi:enamine deaminase RidA (YjgF/YER057c/UK114 family)|nr:RidA family protein [Vicinamibacterales bacterium]